MPAHAPLLNIDIADNRLLSAGYVRRWYPSDKEQWGEINSEHVMRWPGVKCVTLEPVYEPHPAEAAAAQWTQTGSGASFSTVKGLWGSTGEIITQEAPTAGACLLTSSYTPEANQPFFADFYLSAVYDKTWYADLRFGRKWCLRLLYSGAMQVWKNMAPAMAPADWQYLENLQAMEEVRTKHLRLAVYPTASQELIVWPYNQQPQVFVDDEPLVHIGATDGLVYRDICEADPVVFYVSGGAWSFSYRYMRFETEGFLEWPLQALPWDYAGEWTLTGDVARNREGYAPTVTGTLQDAAGTDYSSPPDEAFREFGLTIELESDDALFTPELNWAQLLIEPVSAVHTPLTPVTVRDGGQLTDISAGAELRGRRDARFTLSNIDGTFSDLWARLRMCSSITDVTGVITWWKGYTKKSDGPIDQSGDVRLEFSTADMLSRLDVPLSDAYIGDGQVHTHFVEQLFKRAGLAASDYEIASDTLGLTLPQALGEEEPLFQARDGKTIKELVEYICKLWSGWELYADAAGVIHYAPLTVSASPTVTLQGYETEVDGELKYYSLHSSRDEDAFYNVIVVIGATRGGRPLLGYYYDADSVGNVLDANYLGFEKLLVVVDSNLRTMADVEAALGYVVAEHGQPLEEADVTCAWHDTLDVGDTVAIGGTAGDWQIQSLTRLWEPDARLRLRLKKVS